MNISFKMSFKNLFVFTISLFALVSFVFFKRPEKEKLNNIHASKRSQNLVSSSSAPREFVSLEAAKRLDEPLKSYALRNLEEALGFANSLDPQNSRKALVALFWASIREHPEFVSRFLLDAKIPESERSALIIELVRSWPDVEAVVNWLDDIPKGTHSGEAYGIVMSRLRNEFQSANYALNILDELSGRTRDTAARSFFTSWAATDPLDALDNLSVTTEANDRGIMRRIAAYSLVGLQWKDKELGEVFDLASELSPETEEIVVEAALKQWIKKDWETATSAFEKIGTERKTVVGKALIESWAEGEPVLASEWLGLYRESPERVEMTKQLISRWSSSDPISAYSWLGAIQPGPSRDAGIEILILKEASRDPETAALWTFEFSDPKLAESYLESITRSEFSEE